MTAPRPVTSAIASTRYVDQSSASYTTTSDVSQVYTYLHAYLNITMAPHPGIDAEKIKEKARKDLLDLLEGVCKAMRIICFLALTY